jgi:hypothetical protein
MGELTIQTNNLTIGRNKRRSSEEVREAKLAKEAKLAEAAEARRQKFAEAAAKAQSRLEKSNKKISDIQSGTEPKGPKIELPKIPMDVKRAIEKDFASLVEGLGKKYQAHNLNIDTTNIREIRRGSGISFHVTGSIVSKVKNISAKVAAVGKNAFAATKEALHFIDKSGVIGITPSIVGQEIKLKNADGNFIVAGLSANNKHVLLRKVGDDPKLSPTKMPVDDFKQNFIE